MYLFQTTKCKQSIVPKIMNEWKSLNPFHLKKKSVDFFSLPCLYIAANLYRIDIFLHLLDHMKLFQQLEIN